MEDKLNKKKILKAIFIEEEFPNNAEDKKENIFHNFNSNSKNIKSHLTNNENELIEYCKYSLKMVPKLK